MSIQESECPPILFIIYRRPETTRKVFEAIRMARPSKLFVSQDAMRPDKPGQAEAHAKARSIAMDVDWPCEVKTLFFDEWQGIIQGFKKSLDWFFENVEEGIMLEDDEIPDQSYFRFAAEMLERYRDDERVMSINGSNALQYFDKPYREHSYYFLSVPCVWGMATWRRAWKHYDPYIMDWPKVRDSKLLYEILPSARAAFYFSQKFQEYYERKTNSWDGQWIFASIANRGLSIYPSTNLVSNIGFGSANALHDMLPGDKLWADLPNEPLSFPLRHPSRVAVNKKWDEYAIMIRYPKSVMSIAQRLKFKMASLSPKTYMCAKKAFDKFFHRGRSLSADYSKELSLLP
ncbi:MAG: glycosyltransferase family 2 protein [Patescibacteria group bacterium]|nr:glycosyltransferase family 2 protein [Patescibacteria group bacterium]MDE1941199.1 glycosyltransferase family 2 protein [Patescibacteria group bacterium]MDE1966820.1 glycosyltransferase family 2 protein [Patescibacteria group bacterium]